MRILLNHSKKLDKKGRPQYYVTVKSKNGKILTTSEMFTTKRAAITNANATKYAFKHCWRIHDTVTGHATSLKHH